MCRLAVAVALLALLAHAADAACNCPTRANYLQALGGKGKCAPALEGLGLTDQCKKECVEKPAWRMADCEPAKDAVPAAKEEKPPADLWSGKTRVVKVEADLSNAVKLSAKQWAAKQASMKKPQPSIDDMLAEAEKAYDAGSAKKKKSLFLELAAATRARAAWCTGWNDGDVKTLRANFIASRTPAASDDWTETNGFTYKVFPEDDTPEVAYGFVRRNTAGRAYNGVGYRSGMRDFTRCWFNKDPTHTGDIDCGHIIADSLGGSPRNTYNFFPQERWSNQRGPWYWQEEFVRDLVDNGGAPCQAPKAVYISVRFVYVNTDLVPDGGTYTVFLKKPCIDVWAAKHPKPAWLGKAKKHTSASTGTVYGFLQDTESWSNH